MKIFFATCCISICLVMMAGMTHPKGREQGVEPAVQFFKTQSEAFALSAMQLQNAITAIRQDQPNTIENARKALWNCRVKYKKIEFFLEYFFNSAAFVYNKAPKYEIEEPYMEYQEPIGLQVIEGLLFENNVEANKDELLQQADVVSSSASDLNALLYGFSADDKQLLESIRLELIRIITLGIEGFDAPLLKSGIAESEAALEAIEDVLHPYLTAGSKQSDSVSKYLAGSLHFLKSNQDFDRFDRLAFLTKQMLPLQRHLGLVIKELNLELNTTGGSLNYRAGDIFSVDALNLRSFPHEGNPDSSLIGLGRQLFFESGLSGNNKISCASCHDPAKHFTDALPQSVAFDGHSHVQRNAPSLLYAGFQYQQFWDGRAKSLEDQVRDVINNPQEMSGSDKTLIALLNRKPEYKAVFNKTFPELKDSVTNVDKVAVSIAEFIRSLNPRNSRFDQYIKGDTTALNTKQVKGFNLFMGKAQCGTCHFAPLFNGLTPPFYNLTEVEVLGTTKTDNLEKPEADADLGRFNIFPISFYEKAFKTPTVRNVSATGPYMHNGAFKTLEAVVEFYNKGGAIGLGLPMSNQTLSAASLNLSKEEVNDIVQFLHSLEDSVTVP
jgi:cytochrome c peroxidase